MSNLIDYPYQLPIDKLLNRLQQVKTKRPTKKGLNQWQALCPAHGDKSPSLYITECLDGTVLVKCWTGCTASEIVKAIGLELKDLFKYEPSRQTSVNKSSKRLSTKQAIAHEKLIITIAESHLNQGVMLDAIDTARYKLAQSRLSQIAKLVKFTGG